MTWTVRNREARVQKWRAVELMSRLLFDTLENVRVGFLLPRRQVVPVCHIGWLRIWEMFKDLPDPAESNEASLLRTCEFRGAAAGSVDERANLIVDGSSTLPF